MVELMTLKGLNLSVTTAIAHILPRAEDTLTLSPFLTPNSFASSILISTNCCGIISICHGRCLVKTPVCQCSDTRYVVATKGYLMSQLLNISSGEPVPFP